MGWKGGQWTSTNSSGFQREHDPDPKHRGWSGDDASQPQGDRARFPRELWSSAALAPEPRVRKSVGCSEAGDWHTAPRRPQPHPAKVLCRHSASVTSEKPSAVHLRAVALLLRPLLKVGSPRATLVKRTKGKESVKTRVGRENEGKLLIPGTPYWWLRAGEHPVNTRLCPREANCWPNLMPPGVPANGLLTVNSLGSSTSSRCLPCRLCCTSSPVVKAKNHQSTGWHHLPRLWSSRTSPSQHAGVYRSGWERWRPSRQDGHCRRRFDKLCTSSTLQPPCVTQSYNFWLKE